MFRAKNKFCINFSFFEFFCIPGVMHFFDKSLSSFLRVTSLKFIGNFKNGIADVFQSFLGCFEPKKILYKFLIFWVFLHIRGHGIFEKSLSSFLRVTSLKFIRNFKNGVADVFQSFLGCFEPKKIFYKFLIFWVFLHIRGHGFFEKPLSSILRVAGLKFIGNFTNGVVDVF